MVKRGKKTSSGLGSADSGRVERVLVENFVALQKVMANLSVKFDSLAKQISKLLELFEVSAKSLSGKGPGFEGVGKDTEKLIQKMDNLLEQNKTIARGLALMHETGIGQVPPIQPTTGAGAEFGKSQVQAPLGRSKVVGGEEYQRSISSRRRGPG